MRSEKLMRNVLSSLTVGLLTVQLLVTAPMPSYAAGLPAPALSTSDSARIASPLTPRKSKKSSGIKIKIYPMSNVRRGQTNVPVKVTVPQSGLTCRLELKYYGSD